MSVRPKPVDRRLDPPRVSRGPSRNRSDRPTRGGTHGFAPVEPGKEAVKVVAARGALSEPRWSPDGKNLLTASVRGEFPHRYGFIMVYDTETGTYDPAEHSWTFTSVPSVLPGQVQISGRIHLTPHAQGSTHSCELDVCIKAWGIGGMIERVMEKNTRESFTRNAEFTNRYAKQHGLS